MPYVACPSCGERGKIPPTLVGSRIKCKKCGISFNVAPAAAKAPATAGAQAVAAEAVGAAQEGIAVEGLDAPAWTVSGDPSGDMLKIEPEAEHGPPEGPEVGTRVRGPQLIGVQGIQDPLFARQGLRGQVRPGPPRRGHQPLRTPGMGGPGNVHPSSQGVWRRDQGGNRHPAGTVDVDFKGPFDARPDSASHALAG